MSCSRQSSVRRNGLLLLAAALPVWVAGCFVKPNKEKYESQAGDAGNAPDSSEPGVLPDAKPGPAGGPFELKVVVGGSGKGTVTAQGASIHCPNACVASAVPKGTMITLTAEATATAVFGGWDGPCTGTGPCTLAMDGGKVVGATFHAPGGVVWSQPLPESTALVASPDSVFVGGQFVGQAMIGDQLVVGGSITLPFLAEFGGDGEVRHVYKYEPASISFGAMSRMDTGDFVVAGFTGAQQPQGGRAALLTKIDFMGRPLGTGVYKSFVETVWTFGRRYLLYTVNNMMLEQFDDRGAAIPMTQIMKPFNISDAALMPDGGLVVGGYFQGSLRLGAINWTSSGTEGDWVMARWKPDRSVAWVVTSPADQGAYLEQLTTDPAGDIVVTGHFKVSLQLDNQLFVNRDVGGGAVFVAKFDPMTGKPKWGRYISAVMGLKAKALAADKNAVYVAISSAGDVSVEGVKHRGTTILVKYDTVEGAHVWTTTLDGVVNNINAVEGAVYVLGERLWRLRP